MGEKQKSRFKRSLVVEYKGGGNWKLWRDFIYYSETLDENITVPAGFITDFASIPKVFRSFVSKAGPHVRASVVHDFLYSKTDVGRKAADGIFLEAMRISGVGKAKRFVMYWAVRLFGGMRK